MLEIFLKTLPFFAIIGLGYAAGRVRFFTEEATAYLTKFVFYFALSAMIFQFTATLNIAEFLDWTFVLAYLAASGVVYLLTAFVARMRGLNLAEGAFEAQCAVIGNVGFLGIPMMALLIGPQAVAPIILMLSVDLIFFGSLVVILVNTRGGSNPVKVIGTVFLGLLKNPMIVSIGLGFAWSTARLPMPTVGAEFLTLLGAAATPGALFAIGASLASKSAERVSVALWLSFAKLILHPVAVAISALFIFEVNRFAAGVMIAGAALPVAGNVFILAQHYNVAPQRVSAAILFSTAISVVTIAAAIAWVDTL
jgi:predicted permease